MRVTRRTFAKLAAGAAVTGTLAPARVSAFDAALSAQIRVDTDRARLGEPIVMEIEVTRTDGGSAPSVPMPEGLTDDFEVLRTFENSGFRTLLGNGQMVRESSRTMSLTLAPKTVGEFEYSVTVGTGADAVESNSVKLTIVEASERLPGDPADGSGPPPGLGPLFVWASLDKTEAYVGEQVTYLLDVYKPPEYEVRGALRKALTFSDFFAEELPEGSSRRQIVGDRTYEVQPILRRALFGKAAGTAEIPAAELVLGTFRRRVERSRPVEITIKPLPAEGQPAGFSPNNVGRYTIEASVDRTEIGPGDPFTLTITIEGDGNIKLIDPGTWPEIPGVRRYDPKVDTKVRIGRALGGKRTWTFLAIPERGGSLEIPRFAFDFFDPDEAKYRTVQTEPLTVEVTGPAPGPGVAAAGEDDADETEEIATVVEGTELPRHLPRRRWLDRERWLYGMLAVPTLALAGLGLGVLRRRFGADEVARTRARDRQRRKRRIDAAEAAIESGEGFHAEIAGLLQELAVRRAGNDGIGLPRPELLRLLERRGVETADVRRLEQLLDRCDAARFAAQRGTVEERRELLEDALAMVRSSGLAREGSS